MKDFDKWNTIKKKTEDKNRPRVLLGSLFWCKFGINIGTEYDGKNEDFRRPCIILKKFSNESILIAPLTTKEHKGDWYYLLEFHNKRQFVILNQIKTIDPKRLDQYIGRISENKIKIIINKITELLQ